MKKSLKKNLRYLERYIGKEIIRIHPVDGNWKHTNYPILLLGFTLDGKMRFQYTRDHLEIHGKEVFLLEEQYTDRFWITYKKAIKSKNNPLNKWKGRTIHRVRATITNEGAFMKMPVILKSASKHHMVVEATVDFLHGRVFVLDARFCNPEDWELSQ